MSTQEIEAAARSWYETFTFKTEGELDIDAVVARYDENGSFFDSFPTRFDSGTDYASFTRWAMEEMVSANAILHQVEAEMLGDDVGLVTAHDSFVAAFKDGTKLRMYVPE